MDDAISLSETETKGRYVYSEQGKPDAEMTFSKAGKSLIIIDHTEVPEEYRGQGVGVMLVQKGVEDARLTAKKSCRSARSPRRNFAVIGNGRTCCPDRDRTVTSDFHGPTRLS